MTSRTAKVESLLIDLRCTEFDLGMALHSVKKNESYREEIGEGIDTWHDYLYMIGLTNREASYLISAYLWSNTLDEESLKVVADIPKESLKKLVSNKETDPEMILAAQTLTVKDFKERFYDHKTKDKGKRTYTYMVMKKCNETGTLEKVHGVESEEITKKINVE